MPFTTFLKLANTHFLPLLSIALACEWLSLTDHLDYFTRTTNDGFQVAGYIPAAAGAIHLLCAGESAPRLQWPSRASEAHYKQQQRTRILDELVEAAAGNR